MVGIQTRQLVSRGFSKDGSASNATNGNTRDFRIVSMRMAVGKRALCRPRYPPEPRAEQNLPQASSHSSLVGVFHLASSWMSALSSAAFYNYLYVLLELSPFLSMSGRLSPPITGFHSISRHHDRHPPSNSLRRCRHPPFPFLFITPRT